jgi:type II secretory pathway pseudopilin PulG
MQMRNTQLNRRSGPAIRRGTSLIEILVVLVILVVGILSIVRLFPAGFIALRNAENNTFADRMANGALEQLKKSGNGLPDAIYMYVNNGYDPNYSPTDYTPYTVDATYNDINKQRYVSNETITVPATRMTSGTSFLPLYVLNYGPISLPDLSTHGDYLRVISQPWTPQTGDSRPNPSDPNVPQRSIDNPPDILQAGQQKYLADYNAGAIAVPQAAYNQEFYVQVTRQVEGVQPPVLITVPATFTSPVSGYDGNWFSAVNTDAVTGAASLAPTTATDPWTAVTLYRPFRYVASSTSPTFSIDPYEFAVYSPNIGTDADGNPINPGVLAFNPLASGQNGTPPLQARISYMVLDWHVLHEDHDVSTGATSVRLILGHLKKIGDVQFDQTTYAGVVPNMTTPGDIMMLNLDTGAVTSLNTTNVHNDDDNTGPAAGGNGIYEVTYQNGRVTLPANNSDGSVRPTQHIRFFYAGDADWALAIQKAASVYTKSASATTLTTPGSNTPNLFYVDPTDSTRVYFPLCDAGKTVEFDGVSYTDKNGVAQQTAEGTAQISTDTALIGGVNLVYVNLTDTGLNSSSVLTNADTTKPVTFQAVRGISAQAVVIWHERNLWRSRTIDTLLTQTQ